MRTFAGLVMRSRLVVLTAIGLITLFFLYAQRDLAIRYVDIFPPDHPNTQLQRFMVKTFGGTSAVLVAMEVKEGEIFEPKNLDKLNRVQTAVKNIRGVVPFRIYSIVSPKPRDLRSCMPRSQRETRQPTSAIARPSSEIQTSLARWSLRT